MCTVVSDFWELQMSLGKPIAIFDSKKCLLATIQLTQVRQQCDTFWNICMASWKRTQKPLTWNSLHFPRKKFDRHGFSYCRMDKEESPEVASNSKFTALAKKFRISFLLWQKANTNYTPECHKRISFFLSSPSQTSHSRVRWTVDK